MGDQNIKVGVLGAGTMGAGIAQVAAQAGYDTLVYDVSQEFIDRGLDRIKQFLKGGRERGKITAEQESGTLARLSSSLKLEEFAGCGLTGDEAPGKLGRKREVFQKRDAITPPDALLATNTSSFSVTAIAGAAKKPERVLGLHYFNPPPLMGLVEVVQGQRTTA